MLLLLLRARAAAPSPTLIKTFLIPYEARNMVAGAEGLTFVVPTRQPKFRIPAELRKIRFTR